MEDRQSTNPGRVKFTLDDGTVMFGTIERADSPSVAGTPLNKNTFFNSKNSERYAANLPSEAFELLTQEPVVTLTPTGWSSSADADGYYTQTVEIESMSENYSPMFSLEATTADAISEEELAFSYIKKMETFDGYVVFKATEPVTSAVSVRIKGV